MSAPHVAPTAEAGCLQVSWAHGGADGEAMYLLQRKKQGSLVRPKEAKVVGCSALVTSLSASTMYRFRVAQVTDSPTCQWSEWSTAVRPDGSAVEEEEHKVGSAPKPLQKHPPAQLRKVTASSLLIGWEASPQVPARAQSTWVQVQGSSSGLSEFVSRWTSSSTRTTEKRSVLLDAKPEVHKIRLAWLSAEGQQLGEFSDWSGPMCPSVVPERPVLFRALTHSLSIKWAHPSDQLSTCTGYQVKVHTFTYATESASEQLMLDATVADRAEFVVRGLFPDQSYEVSCRAVYGTFRSLWSEVAVLKTSPLPSEVMASGISEDAITIGWPAPPGGEETVACYEIELTSHAGLQHRTIKDVEVSRRESCVINGLFPATRYTFRVRAIRTNGRADAWTNNWSKYISTAATTPAGRLELLRQVSEESTVSYGSVESTDECSIM